MENENECGWFNKKQINVSKNYEVDFWAIKFGVKPDKIRDTAQKTGSRSVKKIKIHLGVF